MVHVFLQSLGIPPTVIIGIIHVMIIDTVNHLPTTIINNGITVV